MPRNPGDQASTKSWLEELTCCCNSVQHKRYSVRQTTATGWDEAEVPPPGSRGRNHPFMSSTASRLQTLQQIIERDRRGESASHYAWTEQLAFGQALHESTQCRLHHVHDPTATGCGDEAEVHPPGFRRRNHLVASNAASMRDVNKPSLLLSSGQKEKMLKRHAATTGALSVPQTHICMRHDVICMPRSHLDKSQAKNYR